MDLHGQVEQLCLQLDGKMLEVVHGAGWIDTTGGFSIESAISNSQAFVPDTHPVATAVMIKQISLPVVRVLQHHPALIAVFERIFNHKVFPLPRVIPRTLFPNHWSRCFTWWRNCKSYFKWRR